MGEGPETGARLAVDLETGKIALVYAHPDPADGTAASREPECAIVHSPAMPGRPPRPLGDAVGRLRRVLRLWSGMVVATNRPGFYAAQDAALAGAGGGMLLEDYIRQRRTQA